MDCLLNLIQCFKFTGMNDYFNIATFKWLLKIMQYNWTVGTLYKIPPRYIVQFYSDDISIQNLPTHPSADFIMAEPYLPFFRPAAIRILKTDAKPARN